MNKNWLRRVIKRCSVDAPANTKQIFTSSDGWNENEPSCTQFFAPNFSTPNTRLNASSAIPNAAARYRTRFTRSRLRRNSPNTMKNTTPMTMASSSFVSADGSLEAMTHRPIVHRKNARLSTSKPLRRRSL